MRGWLRVGLIGCGSVVVLAGIAATVFVATFDLNTQKDRIVDAVRRATGRELVLAGPLRLSLGWIPIIEAEDAALSNRAGGSRPQMATVARLRASISLLPLLSGRVEIESVRLDRPDILLETDGHGIGNWQFQRPVAAPSAPSEAGTPRAKAVVALHRLVLENGRVTWRNEASGRVTTVDVPHAVLELGQAQDTLVADAQTGGQTLHLDAAMGQGGAERPLKLALDTIGAHLALDGTVAWPLSMRSYRGKVDAKIPDLTALAALFKVDAPRLANVDVAMVAGADGLPQDIRLHIGASDLGTILPGAAITRLDVTLPGIGQAGRIEGEGALPGGPWALASGIIVTEQHLALRALSLTTPGGDLTGDLAVDHGDRWAVRGTVASQRLDVDWLRSLKGVRPASAGPVQPTAQPAPVPPPPHMFSGATLPWNRLRIADADLQFTIGTLHAGTANYRGLAGHATLADGALHIDPLTIQGPQGRIDGSLVADAAQPEPPVALALRSAAFGLDPMLQAAGLPGGSDGVVELDVALSTAGQSMDALMAKLNGHAGLAMINGNVSNAALAAALGNLLPKAARLDAGGSSAVRCLALRLDAKDGQATVAALELDTSRLDLEGSGTVNLADETLALRLRPTVRVGGTGILAPVRMEGSLAHPAVALDAQGVEGRSGIVIGGPPPPDGCAAALTVARGGHAGPMPGPAVVKSTKPADLLRSFLR